MVQNNDTVTAEHGNEHCNRRRRFLLGVTGALAGTLVLPPAHALAKRLDNRALSFENTHTNETLDVVYYKRGYYNSGALQKINHHLRDHRTNDLHEIDRRLLDILYLVSVMTGSERPYQVISGYRSPRTNAMLRSRSHGVAKRSLHMEGKAIDVRLADIDTRTVRKTALALKQGGVGYYRSSNFVHLDTGRVRSW
jgi:uncharacterized protein YcbK (DUF882 family)